MSSIRVLLRPWLVQVCHQCSRQAAPSSIRRLYSSEISTPEPSASRTNNEAAGHTTGGGAFDRGIDGRPFPIGSSNLSKESTNTEPRSHSSGTGILPISRDSNSWTDVAARHPRNGTVDRALGTGGRIVDSSRPALGGVRVSDQGRRSTSTITHARKGDSSMSNLCVGGTFEFPRRCIAFCVLCLALIYFKNRPTACPDGIDGAAPHMLPMNCWLGFSATSSSLPPVLVSFALIRMPKHLTDFFDANPALFTISSWHGFRLPEVVDSDPEGSRRDASRGRHTSPGCTEDAPP
ncbi:hypothetical protein FN846DRAFT_189727 [Sphaerosporella brunnea]|uniref:Uncharacterized protein n=1 Tax=Sphaerosporella brunnea TaxID=1250544 RepID=A0A5J5EPP6_9PEZI|nr:hypothetical protein FN846DRAFT_189727 [Sphaerosporella brunnea]